MVGFAAETDHVEAYARGKLENKRLDLIAANRVGVAGSGFESDDNTLSVFAADGGTQVLGPAPKTQLADALLDLIAQRLPLEPHRRALHDAGIATCAAQYRRSLI